MIIFIGTYTQKSSRGIYGLRFEAGRPSEPWLAGEGRNPSFLALAPDGRHLYATGEVRAGGAGVSAFSIDREHALLQLVNEQPTGGGNTTHGAVDATGQAIIAVSYGTGYVCSLPIEAGGRLGACRTRIEPHGPTGPNRERQDRPHPHSTTLSPDNRFALVCDLGLDRILVYRLDPERAELQANHPPFGVAPPGAGPRHGKFSRDGRFFYVVNEMGGTICAYTFEPERGTLALRQTTSTLPADFHGANGLAEIRLHPNDRFVYASNRGHDSLAVFARDPESGTLETVEIVPCGGRHPRNFALSPDGRWLLCANRDSDNLVTFAVDPASGKLQATGTVRTVPEPVCVLFVDP
jgi:6-phosphogluconolactonase